ncbi:hypothetical protein, partial [Shewanella indica]|uniref:hypothetical protein n=1 Tax=Shewanella indica TaxID=768528 RepID=UPI00399A2C4A
MRSQSLINDDELLEVDSLRRVICVLHTKLRLPGMPTAGLGLLLQNHQGFKVNGGVLLGFVAYPGTIYHHIWPS